MNYDKAMPMTAPGIDRYGSQSPEMQDANAKDTPLNRLLQAVASLEEATGLTYETTNRLCGSQPAEAGNASQEPSPAGMFAAVTLSANRVERMASVIADCMHRINRVAG